MSDRTLTRDGITVHTTEELNKLLAEDRNARANAQNTKTTRDIRRNLQESFRALFAGVKTAAGNQIRGVRQDKDNFLFAGKFNTFTLALPLITEAHNKMLLRNLIDFSEFLKTEVSTAKQDKMLCKNGHPLVVEFGTVQVPKAVKEQLDDEITQVKEAEATLARRYEGGYYGPFLEEKDLFDLKNRFLVYTDPDTGQHFHIADRVEGLVAREKLQNPNASQTACAVNVCYLHKPNADGSRGQRVHISHELNDMDGDLNVTPQHVQKVVAAQPVPRP